MARVLARALRALLAVVVLLALTVGLPTALVHFIGWPLPDHVPTWDEIQSTLLAPMSPQFLLNALACALWPLWARFTFDVLAAIPDTARSAPWHRSARNAHLGPLRAAAGVLVGAIVFSILSSRTTATTTTTHAAATESSAGRHTTIATTLRQPETQSALTGTANRSAIVTAAAHTRAATATPQDMETVRSPEHGVHDSLWRVAQRCLGDGNRWPEIWKLNRGATQADGTVFTTPSLVQPGWQLRLPALAPVSTEPPPVVEHRAPHDPPQASGPDTQAPSSPQPSAPSLPAKAAPPAATASPGTGISLSTGAFVGLGLAALITVAMISVRLHRRSSYQPGAAEPDDPGGAPVVRALRIAHDSATLPHDGEAAPPVLQQSSGSIRLADLETRDRAQATARATLPTQEATVLGVREGQAVALDLARSCGLGLIGPGAHAAARALIVALLAQAENDGQGALVVIPATDAEALFGTDLPRRAPARLRIVDDLPAALSVLEAELLTRIRDDDDDDEADQELEHHADDSANAVLIASPTADTERRMQAILDNGAGLGLAGVLLGQWRPGGTARVRNDGTIGATSPTLAGALAGARLFTLPGTDTTELLALLHAAEPADSERSGQTTTESTSVPRDEADPPRREAIAATDDASADCRIHRTNFEFITAGSHEPAPVTSAQSASPPARVVIDIPFPDSTTKRETAGLPPNGDPRPTPHAQGAAPSAEASTDGKSATSRISDEPVTDQPMPQTPVPASAQLTVREDTPLHLQVLGRLHLMRAEPHPTDLIESLAPRQREILVYLALHPEGSRREVLTAALWPNAPGHRPYNSFHATLSQLRRGLRTATGNEIANITVNDDGHYALDHSVVTVDLWQVLDALTISRHAATALDAEAALRRVAELYRGDLADNISADWIDGPREALRRDVLDAFSSLIRTIGDGDPEQTLALLEQARSLDPYNEAIYRDLMRIQARLGQYDSIPRTLSLLTNSLATLDQRPARDTVGLADFLRQPRNSQLRGREAS
ncbi:transcriptional regulator [Amycolatopsis rubida]|uniref:Transcriptional regulator n=1 Tax=Amycolatopsis rubida TaxID=112413 RepID=A0ABX0BKL7_9PSEU|nr:MULTISPECIES: BTAD domain-containing putative transcriptional regulator [Amycolatopsis]MYW90485.1 transcriptional regulator [Amycolatopsis rubida]MYW95147.1 transcriptional regulator [Amycolatopsis rubida]NEC55464.1 transcriptional regulator [Amycolatopsis rubida]NEC60135.1 transcriptional regulator [Amycolatopsis rubida]